MIRSTLLAGYSDLTRALGGNPQRLLRECGINPRAETDPDSYISFSALCDLLERTASETGCETFGLRLSEAQGINSLGPLGFAMQNSATLREALAEWRQFQSVHMQGARGELRQTGGTLRWCYYVDEPVPDGTTYKRGAVAMAKTADDPKGRSGSQFFVVSGPDAQLPPEYAYVGEVSKGLDTVAAIEALGVGDGPPRKEVTIDSMEVVPSQ